MTTQELIRIVPNPEGHNGRIRSPEEIDYEAIECLRLKVVLGLRDVDIAERMDLTRQTVSKRISHAVQTLGPNTVEVHREICRQRYEVAIQALAPGVEERDPEAVRLWLDATAKYAKLVGAEAPVQAEVHVTVETEQEKQLRDLLAQAERDEKVRESEIVDAEVVE